MEDSEYIKKRKNELTNEIKNSEEELKELRSACKHEIVNIKNTNPEPGSSQLRRVCECCGAELGFPSNEELKENGYKPK